MSKVFPLLVAVLFGINIPSWSQKKLSLSVFTGSGISFFRGPGAVNNSVYYRNGLLFPNDIDTMANPYGKKPFTNFLAGLQADITLSPKWILLLSSQYEHSGGKLTGDSVISPSGSIKANGTCRRYYDFISVNPQIGRMVFQKKVTLTLHTGIEYTLKLNIGNRFDYTDQNGRKNSIGKTGGEPEVNDFRLTFGASIKRKKWSLDLNFKNGLSNYNKNGNGKVFEKLLHIRLLYTFLKV